MLPATYDPGHAAQVIFNTQGEREDALAQAASQMITAFEALLERVLAPPPLPVKGPQSSTPQQPGSGAPGTAAQAATAFATVAAADMAAAAAGAQDPVTSGLPPLASTGSRKLSQSLSIEIPTTPTRRGAPSSEEPSGYPNLGSPVAMGIASYRAAARAASNGGRSQPAAGGDKDSSAVQPTLRPAQMGTPAAEAAESAASQAGKDRERTDAEVSSPQGSQGGYYTIGQRLVEFDRCWAQYLDQFAAWKLQDASQLEDELVSGTQQGAWLVALS
jgi:hypothetical protein